MELSDPAPLEFKELFTSALSLREEGSELAGSGVSEEEEEEVEEEEEEEERFEVFF